MTLSRYHEKYAGYSDEEILRRADEKEAELKAIFERTPLKSEGEVVRVAVMGSGDRRFVSHHERIFSELLGKPVEVTTFDITTEHLEGEDRIIAHDCTKSLTGGPFDITYAHVLLKFIETEKQWDVMMNSYNALKEGGLAIHVFDSSDYGTEGRLQPDGYFSVPLSEYENRMKPLDMNFVEVPVRYGKALVLVK
ncbi:MAG: hypothetical protein HGA31_02550 [Candidatus Moranbacteria bacterium]|nr:hypothetical protein [Candidatus Moranbacteria bacterium]